MVKDISICGFRFQDSSFAISRCGHFDFLCNNFILMHNRTEDNHPVGARGNFDSISCVVEEASDRCSYAEAVLKSIQVMIQNAHVFCICNIS